jgi:hypothetical protein
MEYCTNIRGLFCALFRGLIQATANNAQTLNHQAVIIALLSFYGLYFAFYELFGLYPYVYMVCAIVAYTAFICVLLAFGSVGMACCVLPIAHYSNAVTIL